MQKYKHVQTDKIIDIQVKNKKKPNYSLHPTSILSIKTSVLDTFI